MDFLKKNVINLMLYSKVGRFILKHAIHLFNQRFPKTIYKDSGLCNILMQNLFILLSYSTSVCCIV